MKVVHWKAAALLVAVACMTGAWGLGAFGTAAAQDLLLLGFEYRLLHAGPCIIQLTAMQEPLK